MAENIVSVATLAKLKGCCATLDVPTRQGDDWFVTVESVPYRHPPTTFRHAEYAKACAMARRWLRDG